MGNKWAGAATTKDWEWEYGKIPPHPAPGGVPAGGNEVFADNSAKWCKFADMYRFNRYEGGIGTIDVFWYQESTGFDSTLLNAMATSPGLK